MINVSNEFRQLIGKHTDFKENAEITFSDGTVIELKEKDFTVSNNNIVDASDTNGIPLGVAICRNIQIELMNDDDRFSDYDFFGAIIRLYLTFQLSETVERIEFGTFTVLTPETYGTTIIITALDDMYKADSEYTTGLVFPATVKSVLVDACDTVDIPLGTTTFLNDDFVVNEKPTDMTFRQLFGYIAMIACGNARIDRTGRLRIITYDFDAIADIRNNIDGGSFHPWNNPVYLDGGDFTYNIGDVADGGNFTDAVSYHILTNWKELKVDTDDVVITGISQSYTDENDEQQIAMYGSEGYVLNISNPLTVGKEKEVVELIGSLMVGGRFRQFSGDLVSNPTCEFMDIVSIVDRKNNVYLSFITDINFQFFGFTNLKNSAEPTIRNSAKIYSDATETLVAARKIIKKERTARELAIEQLAKDLSNSSGLFMTYEEQEDGSVIYYMHDKKTLEESMIVWKLTALAFGISTDGGNTYPYGFTVDGTTITRLLYAEGIDADYIDTGAIRITDSSGNIMFMADYDTKQVYINADNVFIGSKSVSQENENIYSYISENANAITSEVSRATEAEGKLSSRITQTADRITAEVKRATDAEGNLSSKITQTADSITAEVSRATTAEGNLSSRIAQTAEQIELKVTKGDVSSQLSIESGQVTLKSNRFVLESTNCSISADGTIKANNVDLSGKITASSGTIGGFTIGSYSLHTSKASFLGDVGVYVGTDGLSCASATVSSVIKSDGSAEFRTYDGIKIWSSTSNYAYVKPGGITIKNSTYTDTTYSEKSIDCYSAFTINAYDGLTIDATSIGTRNVKIQAGSALVYADFKTTTSYLYGGSTGLSIGRSGSKLGFFGNTGDSKKSITSISSTSSATASSCATKINEILTALKAYNLIG